MKLQCTKNLLDELKLKPNENISECLPLFSWHCNVIKVGRRKTVVLVNDLTRCCVVLYGLKAKDFTKFDVLVKEAIKETLAAEHIHQEIIEHYIDDSGEIYYEKTQGKTMVARMNGICRDIQFYFDYLKPERIVQTGISKRANHGIVRGDDKKYVYPYELLQEKLSEYYAREARQVKAFEVKVTLELENRKVYRDLILPADIDFKKLHQILQVAFCWKDYHLHEFSVLKNDICIQRIISYEDEYGDESLHDIKWETEITLHDVLSDDIKLRYVYDFGDYWEHSIQLVKVVESYQGNYPVCTEGEGYTPPEDVGGEGGFEAFDKETINKRLSFGMFSI